MHVKGKFCILNAEFKNTVTVVVQIKMGQIKFKNKVLLVVPSGKIKLLSLTLAKNKHFGHHPCLKTLEFPLNAGVNAQRVHCHQKAVTM